MHNLPVRKGQVQDQRVAACYSIQLGMQASLQCGATLRTANRPAFALRLTKARCAWQARRNSRPIIRGKQNGSLHLENGAGSMLTLFSIPSPPELSALPQTGFRACSRTSTRRIPQQKRFSINWRQSFSQLETLRRKSCGF